MEARILRAFEERLEATLTEKTLRQIRAERVEAEMLIKIASRLQTARAESGTLISVASALRENILRREAQRQALEGESRMNSSSEEYPAESILLSSRLQQSAP